MIPDNVAFEQFFAEKIKERGISLKKLSEATGIAPAHIENLLRGDFENMPSAPYLHGYLVRLGNELGFDGEEWWAKFKKDGVVKNSGERDTLPRNRFIRQSPPKYLWWIGVGVVILIYFAFQLPHILGKPQITVTFPDANPYVTSSSTITITGTVSGADSLYLVGSNDENEQIIIGAGGAWSQGVLLGDGPNPIEIAAKKFLGGETDVTLNVFYQSAGASSSATLNPTQASSTAIPETVPTSSRPAPSNGSSGAQSL